MGKKKTTFSDEEKLRHKESKELFRLVKKVKTFLIQKRIKKKQLDQMSILKNLKIQTVVDYALSSVESIPVEEKTIVDEILETKQIKEFQATFEKKLEELKTQQEKEAEAKLKQTKKNTTSKELIGGRSTKMPTSLFVTSLCGNKNNQDNQMDEKERAEKEIAAFLDEVPKKKNRPGQRARKKRFLEEQKRLGLVPETDIHPKKKQTRAPPQQKQEQPVVVDEESHPSWQAKQALKAKEKDQIHLFAGKKITFD